MSPRGWIILLVALPVVSTVACWLFLAASSPFILWKAARGERPLRQQSLRWPCRREGCPNTVDPHEGNPYCPEHQRPVGS